MKIGWLNRLLGNRGERLAAKFLKHHGMKILARQVRNRYGEIDLIALDGETVVFVEVKSRSTHRAGHPAEAVTTGKQRQLTKTALAWLKHHRFMDRRCRFDVVAVTLRTKDDPVIEHYVNAFEAAQI